jgi:hypothetical protein
MSAAEYVLSRPARGFSEINALAAYAHAHERESFAWVDVSGASESDPACRAYWSWGGIDSSTEAELAALVGGRR